MRIAWIAGFLVGLLLCGVPLAFVFLSLPSIGMFLVIPVGLLVLGVACVAYRNSGLPQKRLHA